VAARGTRFRPSAPVALALADYWRSTRAAFREMPGARGADPAGPAARGTWSMCGALFGGTEESAGHRDGSVRHRSHAGADVLGQAWHCSEARSQQRSGHAGALVGSMASASLRSESHRWRTRSPRGRAGPVPRSGRKRRVPCRHIASAVRFPQSALSGQFSSSILRCSSAGSSLWRLNGKVLQAGNNYTVALRLTLTAVKMFAFSAVVLIRAFFFSSATCLWGDQAVFRCTLVHVSPAGEVSGN
jgi:hypothetical protein